MSVTAHTALIAEDEPLLAQAFKAQLQRAWPELTQVHMATDGPQALALALREAPDVLFLDIRMPGATGLEVAESLAEAWPVSHPGKPLPAIVFVTAYDAHALAAFEAQALDYVMKPVTPERLQRTVQRVQAHLAQRAAISSSAPVADAPWSQWAALAKALEAAKPSQPLLTRLTVSLPQRGDSGSQVMKLVEIRHVLAFQAADKYLRVLAQQNDGDPQVAEYWLRTPLKDLLPRLDPDAFWQIHRGSVVRVDAIDSVVRDAQGKCTLRLRGLNEDWPVSRLYQSRFQAL